MVGGVRARLGGGSRMRGRGKWWWTRGTGTGKFRLLTPPMTPPPPQVASQSPGPPICHRPKGGADPLVSPGAAGGVRGGSTRFFLPPPIAT